MKLFTILCGASGSQKSEIQDGGFQRGNTNISTCIHVGCKVPTAKLMFSRLRNSMKIFPILCDTSRSQKSKMAANKPEIRISQPVYNITAKSQKQLLCFQGR